MWSLKVHFALAAALRLLLIAYGRIHDTIFDVRFTDIDYLVFSDAAGHVRLGGSPFDRATYRYTPIIAWLLTPCAAYPEFGKILFTFFDLISALLVYEIVKIDTKGDLRKSTVSACAVLYNPLNAVIAARGNAESILSFLVLSIIFLLFKKRWIFASVVHGFAIHMKIYPIIYLPSVFLNLAENENSHRKHLTHYIQNSWKNFRGIAYGIFCSATAVGLTWFFYAIYGRTFLEEALFYHLKRKDVKHNFSPYFYPLYLAENDEWISRFAFLPQAILVAIFSLFYADDLCFSWFASTFAFVAFNKVCTSQYFVWYLTFAPLIWYKIPLETREAARMIFAWVAGQILWLALAYLLEFRGYNVFFHVWLASLLFLIVNCWILAKCAQAYARFRVENANSEEMEKKRS